MSTKDLLELFDDLDDGESPHKSKSSPHSWHRIRLKLKKAAKEGSDFVRIQDDFAFEF